jgi:hypothetical protein
VLVSGTAGMSLATVIRMEFAYPGVGILAGDSIQYLSIATAHGVIMVFFMIMPAIFGAFGNFLLPTQLGVHDVAFPRLNSAAFWFLPGGLIMLFQLVCVDRRYQRMNCFNIRELQGILKRKFFTDLVNTSDSHKAFESTLINMRHKNNMSNILMYDQSLLYNFDLTNTSKYKNFSFSPGEIYTYNPISYILGSPNLNLTNSFSFTNIVTTYISLLKDFTRFIYIPTVTSLVTFTNSFYYLQLTITNSLYCNLYLPLNLSQKLTVINAVDNRSPSSTQDYYSNTVNYSTFNNLQAFSFSENTSS